MKRSVDRFRPERLPNARDFYERQFGQLRRVSRGWARVRCCFHSPDKHPSLDVNIDDGHFKCHSCGAKGGGLVDFVMLRDGLTFKQAAQSLGAWDDSLQIDAIVIRQQQEAATRRERERQQAEDLERRYWEAEDWLYAIESIYRDFNSRLADIRSGRVQSHEEETCWHVLALALDEVREAEEEFIRVRCAWPRAPRRATA